jgi:hypothetical protein
MPDHYRTCGFRDRGGIVRRPVVDHQDSSDVSKHAANNISNEFGFRVSRNDR